MYIVSPTVTVGTSHFISLLLLMSMPSIHKVSKNSSLATLSKVRLQTYHKVVHCLMSSSLENCHLLSMMSCISLGSEIEPQVVSVCILVILSRWLCTWQLSLKSSFTCQSSSPADQVVCWTSLIKAIFVSVCGLVNVCQNGWGKHSWILVLVCW